MKEKEEKEKNVIDECLCDKACHRCYKNLIRKERENIENKTT